MGVSSSSPLAFCLDLENDFESALKSIGPKNDEPKVLCSSGSGKSLESSARLRARAQAMTRFTGQETDSGRDSPLWGPKSPKHEAAIKLQKVYKSFRTRRKLADGAVLIEQSWWKLLDFAELKHSSISFFDIQKHETAVSRWSRARTRAAKVGKGLSENGKAQKLALQHWLEAIDPRHRYGHNLHFYYVKWLNSQSKEPFFYWLDIGEGKEVNLVKKCPRSKLQQQCIKYLGPMERKPYEVAVEDGKLVYVETGELLNTTEGCKWIFVLSTSRTLYVGKKKKGSFQHSSFLAGGVTLAAGRIVAQDGILKAVWPHSGHYRPTPENFQDFLSFLRDNKVDLTHVMLDSIDEEDSSSLGKHVRSNSSCDDLFEKERPIVRKVDSEEEPKEDDAKHGLTKRLKSLMIPSNEELIDELMAGRDMAKWSTENSLLESPSDESLSAKDAPFVSKEEDETIPKEDIFDRIESHRKLESFQLGKQLGCKWSTGAGPRIGCLRDYPSGLQCHALEQVNLSPRSKCRLRFEFSTRLSTTPNGGSNLSRCLGGDNHRE